MTLLISVMLTRLFETERSFLMGPMCGKRAERVLAGHWFECFEKKRIIYALIASILLLHGNPRALRSLPSPPPTVHVLLVRRPAGKEVNCMNDHPHVFRTTQSPMQSEEPSKSCEDEYY